MLLDVQEHKTTLSLCSGIFPDTSLAGEVPVQCYCLSRI